MPNPFDGKKKAIWAFGFSAPGTYAAMKPETQRKLSAKLKKKNWVEGNFVARFEVEIEYFGTQAEPKKVSFNHFKKLL